MADILVRASFKENEVGCKKIEQEDVVLEWMAVSFNESCFFDHKVLPLLRGWVKDRGL